MLSVKKRIAKGCGRSVADVNRLIKQFEASRQMMKQMGNLDPVTGMPTQNLNKHDFNP